MQRIEYARYGRPDVLSLGETQRPVPKKGQVLVRVKAAAANPMDWKIRRGELRLMSGRRFPRGLGHDFAGVVEAVGRGVDCLAVGDEVWGTTGIGQAGTFAEFVVAEERHTARKPASLSFEQAAALPIAGLTAWQGLTTANLGAGQSILVTGCLGGVGRAAVQLSRRRGARIAGSCAATGCEEALAAGVDEVVDYRAFDAAAHRGRFDVVFDTAGALSLRDCGLMLKPGGAALHIVPTPAKFVGCLVLPRHKLVFGSPKLEALNALAEAADAGDLMPKIGRTVSLPEAIPALVALEETGRPKGKLVVVPSPRTGSSRTGS